MFLGPNRIERANKQIVRAIKTILNFLCSWYKSVNTPQINTKSDKIVRLGLPVNRTLNGCKIKTPRLIIPIFSFLFDIKLVIKYREHPARTANK